MAKFKIKKIIKDQKGFSLLGTALVAGTAMGVGKVANDAKSVIEGNTEDLK